ncbi:cytochrome b561 isoform X1 [Diachasma alloeum]|uniref:cytochrome b561 isoform X1 n=2 Tax=Diachasma alloeum TaxID=454923 RepID=UPI0007383755|nr:cytochrome b561 isoform X1 [Diachasma alloeum]
MTSRGDYEYHLCADSENMDQIGEPTPPQRLEGFRFLFSVTEAIGGALIVLVFVWITHFRGGFAWSSDVKLQFNWHPFLMTVGLVFLYANGMLIYRIQRNVRKRRLKLLHGGMMVFTLFLTIIALVAVFDMHNYSKPPIPNLYTLHSWVGLTSVILFGCQWLAGLVSFLYPGIQAPLRAAYLPIHAYFGTAGFVGVIASCLIGLNEKAIFALGSDKYSDFTSEGIFINVIGLSFIIFAGLVLYLVSQERYRRLPRPEDEVLLTGQSQ